MQPPAIIPVVDPPAAAASCKEARGFLPPANAKVLVMPDPAIAAAAVARLEADEYAQLAESTKAPNARKDALRKRIMARHSDLLPGESAIEPGNIYDLDIPPKDNERKVTALAKLAKFLGMKKFWTLCTVTVTALEAHVLAADREQFITQARTGGRTIVCTKRFKEAA